MRALPTVRAGHQPSAPDQKRNFETASRFPHQIRFEPLRGDAGLQPRTILRRVLGTVAIVRCS